MTYRALWPSVLGLLSCSGAVNDEGDSSSLTTPIDIEVSDCSTPLEALPWDSPAPVEGAGPIDEELATLDLASMDAQIDISEMLAIYRGMLAYALEISADELGDTLDRDALLANEPMGPVVLGSLLKGDEVTGMDIEFYRRGLQQYYTCSKGFPLRIEGFKAMYWDWTSAEEVQIPESTAKCGARWLYANEEAGVYIAESRTEGPVREVEILLSKNRTDGNLDFLVYDENGDLTDRSQFPTVAGQAHVVAGSPYVCMTCHLNADASPDTWAYDILVPTTGPCAR